MLLYAMITLPADTGLLVSILIACQICLIKGNTNNALQKGQMNKAFQIQINCSKC